MRTKQDSMVVRPAARGSLLVACVAGLASTVSAQEVTQPPAANPGSAPAESTIAIPDAGASTAAPPAPTPAPESPAAPAPAALREGFGPGSKPWNEWSRATGDWGGARTSLEDAGLTINGSFTLDWSTVFSGGLEKRAYTRRFLDINATADLAKLFGWTGATVYADAYHYGGLVGNVVGDAQGTEQLATYRSADQLAELWFQQTFFDGKLRIKAGKIDANVDFDFLAVPVGFLSANGTWDVNQLGQPTYPDPSTGVLAFVNPDEHIYVGVGVFDGATVDGIPTGNRGPATFFSDSKSSSWYIAAETGLTWKSLGSLGAGQLSFGGWTHSGRFARFDGGTDRGTWGVYIMGYQQLTRRPGADDKGLFAFARWSYADKNVSLIEHKVTSGLVVKGTFQGRDADEAGVMWSFAGLSSRSTAEGDEHAIEWYYKLQLLGSISITPDLQYIINPSGNPNIQNTWLGTPSFVVAF